MEVIGTGQDKKNDEGKFIDRTYIILITETEADQITGIAGKPHISGRYKPGLEVNLSRVYEKVEQIISKEAAIKKAAAETKAAADTIINSFPIEG